MEKFGENINTTETNEDFLESIGDQVNFSENYSTLLFSRLLNPNIREQLLKVLEENEKWLAEKSKQPYFKEDCQDPETGQFFFDSEGEIEFRQVAVLDDEYVAKSREQLESELDEGLVTQMTSTNIDLDLLLDESKSSSNPNSSPSDRYAVMGVKRELVTPLSQQDVQNYSMTEAHEKGHALRSMKRSEYLKNLFSPAFDLKAIDDGLIMEKLRKNVSGEITEEQFISSKDVLLNEYLFEFSKPDEIYERLSQLKGYFSMKGDAEFTKKHLDYARQNYLRDGMIDNNMTEFFQAITPETELYFLKLINSAGV